MAVTFELACVCGAMLAYSGNRAGERTVLDEWTAAHTGCEAPLASPPVEPIETAEVHRDAGSGEFVTEEFADLHPATTVEETVERPRRRRR